MISIILDKDFVLLYEGQIYDVKNMNHFSCILEGNSHTIDMCLYTLP